MAAIASCHMLTFLYLASKEGFLVDSYHDEAVGTVSGNENSRLWISRVTLRPRLRVWRKKICRRLQTKAAFTIWRTNNALSQSRKTEIVVSDPRGTEAS